MQRRHQLVTLLIAAVLATGQAQAAPIIEFSTGSAGQGGTITWDGTNLKGSDIPIGAVTISGAPSNNGTFLVTEGHLYFDTGSANVTIQDLYTNVGHNIAIVGCVPQLGYDFPSCGVFGNLMLGTIHGWNESLASQGLLAAFGESFVGNLSVAMGLSPEAGSAAWRLGGFSLAATALNAGEPGTVSETSITNLSVIPEPGTMILLGTGLLVAFHRRKRQSLIKEPRVERQPET